MLKILTISINIQGHGAYGRHRRMAEALIDAGHEVLWLAPDILKPGREKFLKIRAARFWEKGLFGWFFRVKDAFQKYKDELSDVDLIYTVREYDSFVIKLSTGLKEKPHVFFSRGDTYESEKYMMMFPNYISDVIKRPINLLIYPQIQKWVLNKVDLVVVQAEFLKQLIQKRYPGKHYRFSVLPNDTDPRWVHEAVADDEDIDFKKFKRPDDKILIGTVAPIYWQAKGLKVLLEALNELKGRVKLAAIIIGYGPDERIMARYIEEHGLSDFVHFVGKVKYAHRFMNQFDLMVAPTTMVDACPNVVLEALNSEVAILGSDIDAHKNLLSHQELLFANRDSVELANRIALLADNTSLLEKNISLVRNQKTIFDFDWDFRVQELVKNVFYGKENLS